MVGPYPRLDKLCPLIHGPSSLYYSPSLHFMHESMVPYQPPLESARIPGQIEYSLRFSGSGSCVGFKTYTRGKHATCRGHWPRTRLRPQRPTPRTFPILSLIDSGLAGRKRRPVSQQDITWCTEKSLRVGLCDSQPYCRHSPLSAAA